ncbi:Fungal Zn(2)-Cys(6) binuclear cluster domain-containing protein [Penicillium ucsense]|uniref:Fungal Zn(2)-Cys(6) binuclear cluster domain-containing protein n=1 Tax=Penicillium ucsense TaxID=2839758 RepID=A0A8J8W5P6_9EURO|nr:Fungal Zn(2)-Cys(6) binuclear cluster domain-containing protein [Penicillium ucsense]KAF7739235.1 Fungal Zn(2)-Cys(6) binuclear cluster domain-containing protein [Penicillium ucsense]
MSPTLKQRQVACARCFRLKRKCDHAKPECGECRRKGAECLPAKSRKSGENVTIPVAYLKDLEKRVVELAHRLSAVSQASGSCDLNVQTESIESDGEALAAISPENSSFHTSALNRSISPLLCSGMNMPYAEDQLPSSVLSSYPLGQSSHFLKTAVCGFLCHDGLKPSNLGLDSVWLKDLYANLFFAISNCEWPILDQAIWTEWYCERGASGQEWQSFFLHMVYAIGASLCSTMHKDSTHLERSEELFKNAKTKYHLVMSQPSMTLHVQASLLLVVYALHSPSSEDISIIITSILPFCTNAMARARTTERNKCGEHRGSSLGSTTSESLFISCYMLNEIISSGWCRPELASHQIAEKDLCVLGDIIQHADNADPAWNHLFRLRKIQNKIRKLSEQSRWQIFEDKNVLSSSLKSALFIWKQDIPHYGTPSSSGGFRHPDWMRKLYDYSILLLMEERENFFNLEGTGDIFAAVVEVCVQFRRLQGQGHVMCFTWSALVFQFRTAITLLYLIWAAPPVMQIMSGPVHHSSEAMDACSTTLACFASRWKDAIPYYEIFQVLRHGIFPEDAAASSVVSSVQVGFTEVKAYLDLLVKRHLHRAVQAMIEDIMISKFGQVEEFMPRDMEVGLLELS